MLLSDLGPLLDLDQWVLDLSPFVHVPRLPGGDLDILPLITLTGVAALLIGAGLAGFRRRDIPIA